MVVREQVVCFPPLFLRSIYTHFVGVDISKDTLDIAVVSPDNVRLYERQIENKKTVIVAFFKQLSRCVPGFASATTLLCCEHTGLYNRPLLAATQALALPAWVEYAAQINAATGLRRGKTDAVDARRIAAYAARFVDRARLWDAPRPVLAELNRLRARRARLVGVLQVLQTPLSSSEGFFVPAEQLAVPPPLKRYGPTCEPSRRPSRRWWLATRP